MRAVTTSPTASLTYWRQNGAFAAYGAPVSEELTENGRTVQYFQKARFEYHIEFKGTPYETSLGLLGTENLQLVGKPTISGDPWARVTAVANSVTQTYYPQTGHSVSGGFKAFYDAGELRRFGYPLSQPYTTTLSGKQAMVQDFERVRMVQENGTLAVQPLGRTWRRSDEGRATPAHFAAQCRTCWSTSAATFEHWVDVNLSKPKAMTFYEGQWAVQVRSLVSTGKPGHATPTGTYHINRRVYNETMSGGTPGSEDYYYLTNVLYTQYFTYEGHALHYAWWRSQFGVTGSHGCVNEDLTTAKFAWDWLTIGSRVVIHY